MTTLTQAPRIPGFKSEFARVNGVRLHYWLGGDPNGQPVLLWHGFLGTGYTWHKVMPLLAEAGYAVLVPDMRGYGDSDKPEGTGGYDARALAEEFRALVRQIGFGAARPLLLVAHDMGAPPALLWAADHPEDLAGLLYIEVPVMLPEVLGEIIAYTPEAMSRGSMWWWILPLASGVPERLMVGNERAFLTWFYEGAAANRADIGPETVDEYLRTFAGREGVLGALGVYRAAFTSVDQTVPLKTHKVKVPVTSVGGDRANGANVGRMVALLAESVEPVVLPDCGHFVPEEHPEEVLRLVQAMTADNNGKAPGHR